MRILFLMLGCVLFYSCDKKSFTPNTPMEYEVKGLPDTATFEQNDTLELQLSVNYISGTKESVILQISGLPTTIGANLSNSIDTPAFQSSLRFVSKNAATGFYNITITASDRKNTKTYKTLLHILPDPINPAAILVGNYNETGPCISGNVNNTVYITEQLPEFNKIRISGLWNGIPSTVLIADIDPSTQTLSIAPQTVNSAVFRGDGTYGNNQININYTVDFGFSTDSCQVVLNKL